MPRTPSTAVLEAPASPPQAAASVSAPPIQVLHIITRLNVGGPARHAILLGEGLRAYGFRPLVVHGSKDPTEGSLEDLLAPGRVDAIKILSMRRRVRPWSDLSVLCQLTRLIFREQPDIVHTHTAKAGTLGRLAALAYNLTRRRTRRVLVVHTFHGHVFDGYFGAAGSALVRLTERLMALVTDRIITVSERQRREICERYRIAPLSKTDVLEVGSDLEPLLRLGSNTSLRDRLGFAPQHVVFGYVGRLAPIKDPATLVRAFARVVVRAPNARLLLVGDGGLRQEVESLVDELGLADYVCLTGWVRDMVAVYGAIDVGVLASLNEGTPLALIEAMAAARPVVSTAVGGVADIVSHERTGLLVAPGDVDGLANAMTRLAQDAAARDRLGQAARREIGRRFAIDRVLSRLSVFYTRALFERRFERTAAEASVCRPLDTPSSALAAQAEADLLAAELSVAGKT